MRKILLLKLKKITVSNFFRNVLQEESFIKKGILEVFPLALHYNKVYVFNENMEENYTFKKL